MDNNELFRQPHRRYNPLIREWLLVSPQRTQRPWQGQVEKTAEEQKPEYDPSCYLCPGNPRAGGAVTPDYDSVYVFNNDFPALLPDTPEGSFKEDDLLIAVSERGIGRVICFSPRHDLTLARMETSAIRKVVDTWADQYRELGSLDYIGHVQIFENRGAMMGASNPHPHGQIWAQEHIPNEPAKEMAAQADYQASHGSCLLCDYAALEEKDGSRVVIQNEEWLAVVPFWAIWPFETLLMSKRHAGSFLDLDDKQRDALADLLRRLTTRYDNLFEVSFPYSMGFHQTPTDGKAYPGHHLHAHFYPPLLRSATVRKFMVGYELLGNAQRDITAESSAERLRSLSETHYSQR
ncbi:MAG TPA: UDP-glucose--hexose-1-phosphate uridylyltransferase [Chloroflexia bacterium]|nr:UDP-glucose--hexose-1-phosphate uridylyltransferase [Chloroflexia bacterium]